MTSETVAKVLTTVETTRARLRSISEGSSQIQSIAEDAASGLGAVLEAAITNQKWTDDTSAAADQAKALVGGITEQLKKISGRTEAFLAAAEQIAAASEQQTASTEEIAGSAGQLAGVAERLSGDVSSFKLPGR